MTVLGAALSAAGSMFLLNRLPEPYHSVFDTPEFERASKDRFFLWIDGENPAFDPEATRHLLVKLGASRISESAQEAG
jgi:hypothetical protein